MFIPLPRVCSPHLVTRQARGSPAAPAQPCFWSAAGPAPAPPRGRASAGAARRLCADLHVVFTRYCSALLMTRLKATQRRYTRSPRRSAAPRALCFNEAVRASGHSRPTFRKSRRLSVRLLLRRHRSAGCQPKHRAVALDRRSRRWFGAARRRSTRPTILRLGRRKPCDEGIVQNRYRVAQT